MPASILASNQLPPEDRAPEWVRQIICCTAWEVAHPAPDAVDSVVGGGKSRIGGKPAGGVALAVVRHLPDDMLSLTPAGAAKTTTSSPSPSANANANTAAPSPELSAAFVRNVQRATGDLVRVWAPSLGFKVLGVDPSHGHGHGDHHSPGGARERGGVREPDKEGGKRGGPGHRKNRSIDESGQEGGGSGYSGGGGGQGRGRIGGGRSGGGDRGGRDRDSREKNIYLSPASGLPKNGGSNTSSPFSPASGAGVSPLAGGQGKIRLLARGEKLEP